MEPLIATARRRQERRAGQRCGNAGDQRPRRAARARGARRRDIRSMPLPGPSAVAAAVSAAGLDAEAFVFAGLPAAAGQGAARAARPLSRRCRWRSCSTRRRIACARRSPTWPPRSAATARWSSRANSPRRSRRSRACRSAKPPAWFAADPNRERGEFVLIVDVRPPQPRVADETLSPDAERWLVALLEELPPARAARVVAAVDRHRRATPSTRARSRSSRAADHGRAGSRSKRLVASRSSTACSCWL